MHCTWSVRTVWIVRNLLLPFSTYIGKLKLFEYTVSVPIVIV